MKFFDLAFTMAYDAKITYEDVYSPVKMWDNIIYNYLLEQKTVIPNRPKQTGDAASYAGGYVKDPLVGKHKWAASFDLNSLYPMLICQYNMSPETLVDGERLPITVDSILDGKADLSYAFEQDYCVTGSGCLFRKDKRGLLPTLMQLYYDRRVLYKKAMLKTRQEYENTKNEALLKEIARLNNLQMAVKIAINSAYGAFANTWFRYSDVRIAESITLSGQLSIRWIANKLNVLINKTMKTDNVDRVVLIDTDSVVLTLEDLVEKFCVGKDTEQRIRYMDKIAEEIIQPYLDKSYQELADKMNAYEQKMVMKRENLVDVMISTAKKRYVMNVHNSEGVQYKTPKLKIMGMDMVKSSTPAVVRTQLKDSLKVVLHGTQDDLQAYVRDFKAKFRDYTAREIAFPRGVSNIAQYVCPTSIYKKATPIHVRGAILYNYHLKRLGLDKKYPAIREGDKIRFVYLKPNNPFCENVISFIDKIPPEFGLDSYVNYDIMFEKAFQDSVQNVVGALGWHAESVPTLEDFFA